MTSRTSSTSAGGDRGRAGRFLAAQRGLGPGVQVVDQAGAPRRPRDRADGDGVGFGQGAQHLQRLQPAADRSDQVVDGPRVVRVPPGGQLDQSQVLADQPLDHLAVLGNQADPPGHLAGQRRTDRRMVVRTRKFAQIVDQGGDHQQVRPGGVAQRGLDADHRLDQVPVHGVPVNRVALRAVSHSGPFRDPAGDQAGAVQRLPDADQGGATGQHRDEGVPGRGRPRVGQRWAVVGQVVHGDRRQRQAGPHGGGRGAQRQHRILGHPDAGAEHDLAVMLDQSVAERSQPGTARTGPQPPGGQRLPGPPHGHVHGVGDGPGRVADLGQQFVRVGQPADHGDRILFGQQQPVGALAGHRLQSVADVEQHHVRLVDRTVRPVGDPAGRQGAQHGDVAQPTAGLFQVGFQQVGGLAEAGRALGQRFQHLRQAAPDAVAPVAEQRGAGADHQ